ncbi:MAG: hypothetical protein OER86_03290 [Phycisphaerae bacterium]|nr:hypothetical protein [Phycisphaerae bacterium]
MRSPRLRLAVLLWLGWWFGWMVPAHQRGFVTLDPQPAGDRSHATKACCAPVSPASDQDPASKFPDPASRCALCFLVATLDVPPPVTWFQPPVDLLTTLTWTGPTDLILALTPSTRRGRAPPALL